MFNYDNLINLPDKLLADFRWKNFIYVALFSSLAPLPICLRARSDLQSALTREDDAFNIGMT